MSTKKVITLSRRNNSNSNIGIEESEPEENYLKPISDRNSLNTSFRKQEGGGFSFDNLLDKISQHRNIESFEESFDTMKNIMESSEKPNLQITIKNKQSLLIFN